MTFPDAFADTSWTDALISLVKDDRIKSMEIRKVNGAGLADAPDGVVELLRSAGFADGYRGMVARR